LGQQGCGSQQRETENGKYACLVHIVPTHLSLQSFATMNRLFGSDEEAYRCLRAVLHRPPFIVLQAASTIPSTSENLCDVAEEDVHKPSLTNWMPKLTLFPRVSA
jgi:hypothetical protein